jgi:predicted  nucleic acid-binding Zn-ribbon protein
LATLSRRQSELEDAELELMEQQEKAQSTLELVLERISTRRAERDETQQRRDQAVADLTKERTFREQGRAPLVADLPADLVAVYEKIRESSGMGAALLRAGRCEGCRLEFSGQERARLKAAPADEVLRCEECRRILVRTSESGL